MRSIIFASLLFFSFGAFAQNGVNKEKYRLKIARAVDEIVLDGLLLEESWAKADTTSPFQNKWPTDIGSPPTQTVMRLTYDDQFIYVSAYCHEDSPNYIIETMKRDASLWDSDGLFVFLDPVNQQSNGFLFHTSAIGVQTEGLIRASGRDMISRDWDNKWFVKTTSQPNGDWTVEMAIPFKTLRYDPSLDEWGINFLRGDVGNNMFSSWAHVPLQFNGPDLSYAGTLEWDNPPPSVKSNFSIIPYVTGGISKDNEADDTSPQSQFNAGLDGKVAVTNSLNLDLTVNPDFSQIEVDQQQTNLTRFSIFFPERRTFFLENSDIFSDFGLRPVRPFFSRRIGLDDDAEPVPIHFGARLSGNTSEDTRIGLMTMQTGGTDATTGQNYSVASVHQQVLSRSVIKGIIINRQAYGSDGFQQNDYGRNAGLEFRYVQPDGNFSTWAGYHQSFSPQKFKDGGMFNTGLSYNNRALSLNQSIMDLGSNFITDAGFNRRLDNYDAKRDTTVRIGYTHSFTDVSYKIFPERENGLVQFHTLGVELFNVLSRDFGFSLSNSEISYRAFLRNTARFRLKAELTAEELPFETDLLGDEDFDFLPSGWYRFATGEIGYQSNDRKLFSYEIGAEVGGFYNGTLTKFEGALKYRTQPWGNFSVNFERNLVRLPENYGTAEIWLIGPRIEINFNKSMFWTTFLQYNTQSDNFNINSRFQWRYSPMSDLFLVYTDNYGVDNFGLVNRAVVLKFNYWWTI